MHGETDKVFRRQDGPRRRTESGELMLMMLARLCWKSFSAWRYGERGKKGLVDARSRVS